MGCHTIGNSNGTIAGVACSRGRRGNRCKECGAAATKQCDFPLTGNRAGETCDAYLCERCATHVGPDRDYCPPHVRVEQKRQLSLPIVAPVAVEKDPV